MSAAAAATSIPSSTQTSSAATPSSEPALSRRSLKPASYEYHAFATSSRDARSSSVWSGSNSSSNAKTKLSRCFSHLLLPGRPKYTPNSATSSPLAPGPLLTPVQYGGPKMHISSRSLSRGQVHFRLSTTVNGVTTLYPEDVPLERLFDFITPEQLQSYEHEQYAIEDEQEKSRKAAKRRGRPPGSKKKLNAIGASTQAESGLLDTGSSSKDTTSPITSETDPLQKDSERDAFERAPPPPSSAQSTSSTEASSRTTASQQSEEAERGRYQMLPPTPRRLLQTVSRSPTTSPVPLKTEDTDDKQSANSEALLRQFHGQSVQSLKQHSPSTRHISKPSHAPFSTKVIRHTSPPPPLSSPSTIKPRPSLSDASLSTPRTTTAKKRKRLFTPSRKPHHPKNPRVSAAAEEEDWFIERILAHRKPSYPSPFNWEYLVKWQDHPHEENTWQSEDSLADADAVLKNYHARCAVEGAGAHGRGWVKAVVGGEEGDEDGDAEMSG